MSIHTNEPKDPVATLKILWAAFLVTQFFFIIILFILKKDWDPGSIDPQLQGTKELTGLVLALMGFVSLLLGFVIPKFIKSGKPTKTGSPSTNGQKEIFQKAFAPYIIRMAVFESCSLMGVLASVMTMNYLYGVPCIVAAIIVIALNYPSEERMRSLVS